MTQGSVAYLQFNENHTVAEVFLPNKDKGLVLTKTSEGNWSNRRYTLISWKGYVLQENGKPVFGGQ